MFSRTLRLGRIRGIDVRLSPTLPLFAVVVLWAFAARFTPAHGLAVALAMAAGGMLLFFGSILAHELGHALEARHRDLEVVGVTLSMFGGVTEMHAERQTARDELAVAAIGPYLSVLCAAVFGLVATFGPDVVPGVVGAAMGEVAGLLGWINLALAVFNLIPGAPLDGGRMLRAALWVVLRDRTRAIVAAARFGQALWLAVVVVAVWVYATDPQLRLDATLLGVVGLFLFDAARREIRSSRLDALYSGRTVGELLVGPAPEPVPTDRSLELLPPSGASDGPGSRFVVVVDDGSPVGLLDVQAASELHATDRSVRSAGELMWLLDRLPAVEDTDDLHALVDRFQGEATIVVVYRDGTPVGAITQREAARAIGALRDRRSDRGAASEPTRTAAGS